MGDYKNNKITYEKPYRQAQFMYDLIYAKFIKEENNNRFLNKYCRLNEKIKEEEQY